MTHPTRPQPTRPPPAVADTCPSCGLPVPTTANACPSCGTWLRGPTVAVPGATDPEARGRRTTWLVVALAALVVVLVVALVVVVLVTRDDGSTTTVLPAGSSTTAPSTTAPSTTPSTTTTIPPTAPPTAPPTLPPTVAPTGWRAVIADTCDQGGTCGVKQRTAPYTDAPRLYPNDLQDGTSVTVVCQTTGDIRSSVGHGSSNVWYRLDNGADINSVYFDIQASGIPAC